MKNLPGPGLSWIPRKQAVVQVKENSSEDETLALDMEIAKLEGLIKDLEQHSEDLAGLSSRMSV